MNEEGEQGWKWISRTISNNRTVTPDPPCVEVGDKELFAYLEGGIKYERHFRQNSANPVETDLM